MTKENPTTTNPTLVPNRGDTDTGFGWTTDRLQFVVAGTTVVEIPFNRGWPPEERDGQI